MSKTLGTGKHQGSKKGFKHAKNPSARPSSGKRQKVAKRATKNVAPLRAYLAEVYLVELKAKKRDYNNMR